MVYVLFKITVCIISQRNWAVLSVAKKRKPAKKRKEENV